jgi:hypothetical protein
MISGDKFAFRKHASIGAAAAEEDSKFLAECFVDNGDLEPLTDCGDPGAHNKKDVFYGPPGVQFASGLPLASYDCLAASFAVLARLEIEGGNHPSLKIG